MRLFLLLACLCLSVSSYAQRPPIPNLPAISLEDAGFNLDSIQALIPMLDNFQQNDFRGLVVIKDHQVVMEWYKNQRTFNGKKTDYLWASGNGGNHLVAAPGENMVIALGSTAYGSRYGQERSYAILKKLLNALE